MRLPKSPREGTQAHALALRRLGTARTEQRERSHVRDAARNTPGEHAAAKQLADANELLAAREAWVRWIERDY
jgi:hypothetical protein